MPIFRVKSVKIYTSQKKFTRIYPWDPWQISGMGLEWIPLRLLCGANNICIFYHLISLNHIYPVYTDTTIQNSLFQTSPLILIQCKGSYSIFIISRLLICRQRLYWWVAFTIKPLSRLLLQWLNNFVDIKGKCTISPLLAHRIWIAELLHSC